MSCLQTTPYSPTIPRTQPDHSCEGRNLLAMGGNAALVSGVAACKKEIPAFAGMVYGGTGIYRQIRHCRRPPLSPTQSPNPPTIPPSPSRPFLRRQESHSVVPTNNTVFAHNPPHTTRPFLRRQESHSVVPANNGKIAHKSPHTTRPFLRRQESQRATPFPVAIGGIYLWTGVYRHILPIVHIRHCEIPAFAGMVFLMDSARKKTISKPPNIRA